MERLGNVQQKWAEYRPSKTVWFWSSTACILATMVLGFSWGGWVTGSTAARQSVQAADKARTEVVASYCVSRFEKAPDAATQLAALKTTDSWRRSDFIDKGGWAQLPGMKATDEAYALCADRLMNVALPAKSATEG